MYRRHFWLFAGISALLAIPSAASSGFNIFAVFGSFFQPASQLDSTTYIESELAPGRGQVVAHLPDRVPARRSHLRGQDRVGRVRCRAGGRTLALFLLVHPVGDRRRHQRHRRRRGQPRPADRGGADLLRSTSPSRGARPFPNGAPPGCAARHALNRARLARCIAALALSAALTSATVLTAAT